MLEYITLTDDERALVEEGIGLHQALLDRLADVPTPAGPTPRELSAGRPTLPLPMLADVVAPSRTPPSPAAGEREGA
jgi:hypothetical protein